ncbi:MAG: hypothetical protein GXP37_01070 [Chloroflexi bacterium]|nr:hypothetical protein [Chloroflexota bacterium]
MRSNKAYILAMFALLFLFSPFFYSPAGAAPVATCTSAATGNWSAVATWDCGHVPTTGDIVVIASGHTVTVDADTATLSSLTVAGTLQFDSTGVGRTMTVSGNLTVDSGGAFNISTTGLSTIHSMLLGGDLSNAGTFDAEPVGTHVIEITFNKTGDQNVSNTGTMTFNKITMSKGSVSNRVIASGDMTVGSGAADFDPADGTWEQTSGILSKSGGNIDVSATGGLVFSGSSGLSMAVNASLISAGIFTVNTSGTVAIGNGTNRLEVSGGTATFTAGTVDVGGRLSLRGGTTTINGANISIDPQGSNSLAGSKDVFSATGTAAVTMSSGSLTIVDPNANVDNGQEISLTAGSGTKSLTGGVIYLGDGVSNSAGGDAFEIDSGGISLANLTINDQKGGSNRTVQLVSSALSLSDSLTIASGGTLDANGQNINLQGDWANNGAFTSSTGTVTFDGSATQTIGGTIATTFNDLSINNGATVIVPSSSQPTVEGAVTNNGTLQQTKTIGAPTTSFLYLQNQGSNADKYRGIDLSGLSVDATVSVAGHQSTCSRVAANSYPVQRCYTISPTSAGSTTTVFYYEYSELQGTKGQDPATLYVWQDNGDGSWTKITPDSRSTCASGDVGCSVTVNSLSLSAGANHYVLANYDPQAVQLDYFSVVAQGGVVLISWQTVSELNHFGFNLYRRQAPGDVWQRLNAHLILSPSPGSPEGRLYRWNDAAALPGTSYVYRLDDVDLNGINQTVATLLFYNPLPETNYPLWIPLVM